MVIIAGSVYVAPEVRDQWVQDHYEVTKRARNAPGCVDLHVSADLVERDRVNIFEVWESEAHLEAWRAVADPPPRPEVRGGNVNKYRISSVEPPF